MADVVEFLKHEKGASVVEFSVALIIAFLVLASVAQIARVWSITETLNRTAHITAQDANEQLHRYYYLPPRRWRSRQILDIVEANLNTSFWTYEMEPVWSCRRVPGRLSVCVEPRTPRCTGYIRITLLWPSFELGFEPLGSWKLDLVGGAVVPAWGC